MTILAFGTPGPSEWALILVIVLVLFGAKKLPELARSLGQSMNEFRKAREDFDRELQQASNDVKGKSEPTAQNVAQNQPAQPQIVAQTGTQQHQQTTEQATSSSPTQEQVKS
jgi:sec-independent protein translocase protein TatA